MLCGLIDKLYDIASGVYKTVDTGRIVSFKEINENSVVLSYSDDRNIYGIELKGKSNRKIVGNLKHLFRHISNKQNADILINIIKNKMQTFIYVYSKDFETIKTIKNMLGVKEIMSGMDIARSFGDYFLFYDYKIANNTLINKYKQLVDSAIENEQFHTIADMAVRKLLKEKNVYQMISKEYKTIDIMEFFSATWEGVLSIFIDPTR